MDRSQTAHCDINFETGLSHVALKRVDPVPRTYIPMCVAATFSDVLRLKLAFETGLSRF